MQFDMGAQTLGNLTKQSDGSQQDLGTLVKKLITDVTPLEGKFSGEGKAKFDNFKLRVDDIASNLNGALASIVGGQSGMDVAFTTGDVEAGDNAGQSESSANFDAATFGSNRSA